MELGQVLGEIGLSDKESAAYLAILQLGRTTVKPISDRAKIKRTSIYNFIDRLLELGLVSKVNIRSRAYYEAQPPERLLQLQQERMLRVEEALPELRGMFSLSARKPRISYFEGPEQVKNIVRQEPNCKKEVLYIWPGKPIMEMIGGVDFMASIDRARIDKGVVVRTIRFKHKDVTFPTSGHGPKFLRELRFAPPSVDINMGLGIYDIGKVGFFSTAREGFGILIESQELMMLMRQLYACLWERCIPARPGEG